MVAWGRMGGKGDRDTALFETERVTMVDGPQP